MQYIVEGGVIHPLLYHPCTILLSSVKYIKLEARRVTNFIVQYADCF